MTICIAAISANGDAIITASDHMISCGKLAFDDVSLKIDPIHPRWHAMIAGDVSSWPIPVLEMMRRKLGAVKAHEEPKGVMDIVASLRAAFRKELNDVAVDMVLAPLFASVRQFKGDGAKILGRNRFEDWVRKIEKIGMDCGLLITGFDGKGEPHILSFMGKKTGIGYYDSVGYWAIGSGAYKALDILLTHSYNVTKPLGESIYRVLQSKFISESVRGVGRKTFLCVFGKEGDRRYILESNLNRIRTAWEADKFGFPQVIVAEIPQMLIQGW